MEYSVILSVGSNCGYEEVESAIAWLKRILSSFRSSSLYKTPAIQGYGNPYVNAVAGGVTELDFEALNLLMKEYEFKAGRDEVSRKMNIVPIDIDIVIWEGEVVRPRDYRHSFFQIGYGQLQHALVR